MCSVLTLNGWTGASGRWARRRTLKLQYCVPKYDVFRGGPQMAGPVLPGLGLEDELPRARYWIRTSGPSGVRSNDIIGTNCSLFLRRLANIISLLNYPTSVF